MKKGLIVLAMVLGLYGTSFAVAGSSGDYMSPKAESKATAIGIGGGGGSATASPTINVDTPRGYIESPEIGPYIPDMTPPGAVRDVTGMIFLPAGLQAMKKGDTYVESITFNGWAMDRVRLEDLSQDILKRFNEIKGKWAEAGQIRVQVWRNPQTKGWGTSSGASGGSSTVDGMTGLAGGAVGLIGYSTNYRDDRYVIMFFRLPY